MKSLWTIALIVCLEAAAQGTASRVIGEVTVHSGDSVTVRTDGGDAVAVRTRADTVWLRIPPGERDLKKAIRIAPAEVGPGDRVLARGAAAPGDPSMVASTVIVITKSDLAQKNQRDLEEWRRRGIAGRVVGVDAANRRFTMTVLSREPGETLVVDVSGAAEFRRYAPGSARFADARPGSLADLQPGDQVRVLGEHDDAAASVKAERVVSGAFRNIAGTVISVDAMRHELRVRDLETKQPVSVRIESDTTLRRLPPMLAVMLARRFNSGAAGQRAAAMPARPAANGRFGGGDLQSVLERMPPFALGDLKPGEALLIAGTRDADPGRSTALTLLSGVEPLLTAPNAASRVGGMWNFGEVVLPQ